MVQKIDLVKDHPALGKLVFEPFQEGLCAQIMHVGPYHEIYLGDPPRTAPERLKTVIRQPAGS